MLLVESINYVIIIMMIKRIHPNQTYLNYALSYLEIISNTEIYKLCIKAEYYLSFGITAYNIIDIYNRLSYFYLLYNYKSIYKLLLKLRNFL